ncbi:MAG: hypothetical protein N3D09_04945 [Archaeoglobaceae archaeon]|nr:hypothetical protein [Archaeoglobaceae archaeon]
MRSLVILFLFLQISIAQAQISAWVDPSGYAIYPEDIVVVYLSVFQFGYHVDAIQRGNVQILYPYESSSSVIHVERGEKVVFRVKTIDVTHAFYIFHYLPYPSEKLYLIYPGIVEEIGPILFDTVGKFKIRDPVVCDALNPFDYADIIVEPNTPFYISVFLAILVFLFGIFYARRGVGDGRELDLLSIPFFGKRLKNLLKSRGSTFFLQWVNLVIFLLIIVTGLFGNPSGGENFSIIIVWVLWFALVEYMIFFSGRTWCTMCPMPVFGEWVARKRVLSVNRKFFSLNKSWPKSIDNMWISALGFLVLSLFIVWIVTRPVATAFLFLILILAGIFCHLYNPLRYFCRSLCPANGYIGYHSNASILSIERKNKEICIRHRHKDCVNGNKNGYGCPWVIYPGGKDENTYCGQCFECLRTCPLDNMTVKIRSLNKIISDLSRIAVRAKNKYDEAWMGFIRFTTAIFYELVFFSAWGLKYLGDMNKTWGANLASIEVLTPSMKDLANWFDWAIIVSSISLIIFPAIFYLVSYLSKVIARVEESTGRLFVSLSYSLVPYGLFIWMSFALSLVLVNWVKIVNVLTDPFGLGWDFLGIGKHLLKPIAPDILLYLQIPFILFGLFFATVVTYEIGRVLTQDKTKAQRICFIVGSLHVLSAIVAIWVVVG